MKTIFGFIWKFLFVFSLGIISAILLTALALGLAIMIKSWRQ